MEKVADVRMEEAIRQKRLTEQLVEIHRLEIENMKMMINMKNREYEEDERRRLQKHEEETNMMRDGVPKLREDCGNKILRFFS